MTPKAIFDALGETLPILPAIVVVLIFGLAARLSRRFWTRNQQSDTSAHFRLQLTHMVLVIVGMLAFVVVLPIDPALRGQLLSLIGIVLSAAIALASTTFVGNVMAGMMLKAVRNFRTGDYIEVEKYWGRVSERGLLSTEIQTEFRDLVTLPNLFLVTHPVKVVRTSGTLIKATVSLGYDVPRRQVEELMLAAAGNCELAEPFVQVRELGDFSVVYRVTGLLKDTKQLITARSRLRAALLDALHEGGVEIVSPNFMNQRVLAEDKNFIPEQVARTGDAEAENLGAVPDEVIFDKANEAESIEQLALDATRTQEEIEAIHKELKQADTDEEKQRLEHKEAVLKDRLEGLLETRKRSLDEAAAQGD